MILGALWGVLGHPGSSLGAAWELWEGPGGPSKVLGVALGTPRGSGDPLPTMMGDRNGPERGPRVPGGIKGGSNKE